MKQIQQVQTFPTGQGRLREENLVKDIDNLMSTFIQNASHELRTPLTIIQGYAELLGEGALGELAPEQQEAMYIIVNRAQELRTLVERIGLLMTIEGHRSVSVPLALAETLVDVVEEKRATAAKAGLILETYLEPDLPSVSGDPYQLQQVTDCLLDNAFKFTPDGGRVEVQVYAESDWVCLAVSDTGIGMPEQELEHIFAGFYQIDGSTTRRYGGLGLGLTVVKAVVEEHGGRIEVESQPGKGSRFIVKLPALPDDAQVRQSAEGDAALRRILVVDDEEHVVLTFQEGLKRLPNCEVSTAMSGEQALQLFEQQPFDLLITDYKMPHMDGVTLAAQVRQLYPRTGIIMITAYSDHLLQKPAAVASIQRVLDKPVELAEIRSVASEALNQ